MHLFRTEFLLTLSLIHRTNDDRNSFVELCWSVVRDHLLLKPIEGSRTPAWAHQGSYRSSVVRRRAFALRQLVPVATESPEELEEDRKEEELGSADAKRAAEGLEVHLVQSGRPVIPLLDSSPRKLSLLLVGLGYSSISRLGDSLLRQYHRQKEETEGKSGDLPWKMQLAHTLVAWRPLQTLCRDPVDALTRSTRLPFSILDYCVREFVDVPR